MLAGRSSCEPREDAVQVGLGELRTDATRVALRPYGSYFATQHPTVGGSHGTSGSMQSGNDSPKMIRNSKIKIGTRKNTWPVGPTLSAASRSTRTRNSSTAPAKFGTLLDRTIK